MPERRRRMWVTPTYKNSDFSEPLTLEDKISIFADRTYGWQLDIADKCINGTRDSVGNIVSQPIPHSGFAVLHIVFSYFEMIAKFQDGFIDRGKSKDYFKKGVRSVFPALKNEPADLVDELLDILYEGVRCGLYHCGFTDPRVILTGELNVPMRFDSQRRKLIINPHQLAPELKTHLAEYKRQLGDLNNTQLRQNFERRFDYISLGSLHKLGAKS